MATISENNLISQSPYLYLQGAGSDGIDGSASGVHLRWDFGEALATVHIPKGNLAAQGSAYYTSAGFNKANDFVKIYRTSYNRNFPIIIDFATMAPSDIIDETQTWIYNDIVPVPALTENKSNVYIHFDDPDKYNQVRQQYNPASDRLNFLKSYDGIIYVEVEGRLMFSAYIQMQPIDEDAESITKIESVSRTNEDGAEAFISGRKKYQSGISSYLQKENLDFLLQENGGYLEIERLGIGADNGKIIAENIQYIRFQGENCFPTMLLLETYQDFLLGKNQLNDWEFKSDLSLSIETEEVLKRLEETEGQITKWPKYVNGATINVENYKKRWSGKGTDDEGLRDGVIEYLKLSKDAGNLRACNEPSGEQPEDGEYVHEFEYSYLDLLKLAAFDFHVARMLGFGYIDSDISNSTDQYIYIAVYETNAALDMMPEGLRTHTFMTLPIGKTDYKLPVTPELSELKYGFTISGETEIPIELTDDKGYSKYDNSRAIGLYVEPFESMKEIGEFFVPDNDYSYADQTEPILYGIAYRKNGVAGWNKPEINHDSEFKDPKGIYESVAVIRPDTENNLIYTHLETEPGIHDYAVYGVNWFSRVSQLSNIRETDNTDFPIRNTLIPPLNLGVQLIQKENPLIFTTRAEQEKLNALTSADKTLVRLTFEWNDVHASNYWYGKEVEFFFRTEPINFIKGKIKSVTDLGAGLYDIHTESYEINSILETVSPIVPAEKEGRFVNSFLTINDQEYHYQVQCVSQSDILGEGAVFTVKAPEKRELVDTDDDVSHVVNAPVPPKAGTTFFIPENTSLTTGWSVPLTQKVTLKNFSDYTEEYIDSEGNTTETHIGGISEEASIEEFEDVDDHGNKIPGSHTGMYRIVFNTYILDPHENPDVEWYKGSLRVKVTKENGEEDTRVLEVWSIEKDTSTLQLIAYDGTFKIPEDASEEDEEDSDDEPKEVYTPIPTGDNINVNYHPGYRVYFTHEPGFDQSSLLPAAGAGSKQTLIACRSTDPSLGIFSPLSVPAVILGREIIEPMKPETPVGALFATRPNFYGKATYTFDTEVNTANNTREPYALVFYRANEQIILDTLYKHDTVLQIQEDLANIENDTAFTSRWNELVNVIVDESKRFKEWNGYRFPNPDNDNFSIPNQDSLAEPICPFEITKNPGSTELVDGTEEIFGQAKTYKEIVELAINSRFLPLTEQPAIYGYLKTGNQTSDRKPVIRDSNGDLIMPGSTNYDGAPMAVKYTADSGKKMVRFTDYTLDGASTSIYFYYAIEMNNTLTVSERSGILGPIQLINTAPPKAPEIRKFYTRVENTVTGDTTAVLFDVNEYPQGEEISKILIYRALNSVDAMTVRTMQLAATVDVNDPVIDDFSDLDFYPFGEVLYYRLVAVRTVKTEIIDVNEGIYKTEDVPSYPSSLILANIIDVNNPPAPELSYTVGEDSTEDVLENVVIEWPPTAYNGTYYLYQMNNSGNWTELYRIKTNTDTVQYELPDSLSKTDEDGENIYYRFKVTVENSSGLFSIEEKILTI